MIFVSTTGDFLDDTQQAAFERFIRSGKGYVGIHAAADTEYWTSAIPSVSTIREAIGGI